LIIITYFDKITFMSQVNPASFFAEVKAELLKVTWPTKEQITRLTGVVVLISVIVGLYVGGLDFIFTKIIEIILK